MLLDEYQDTGHAQVETLRGLFGAGPPGHRGRRPVPVDLRLARGERGQHRPLRDHVPAPPTARRPTVFPLATSFRNDRRDPRRARTRSPRRCAPAPAHRSSCGPAPPPAPGAVARRAHRTPSRTKPAGWPRSCARRGTRCRPATAPPRCSCAGARRSRCWPRRCRPRGCRSRWSASAACSPRRGRRRRRHPAGARPPRRRHRARPAAHRRALADRAARPRRAAHAGAMAGPPARPTPARSRRPAPRPLSLVEALDDLGAGRRATRRAATGAWPQLSEELRRLRRRVDRAAARTGRRRRAHDRASTSRWPPAPTAPHVGRVHLDRFLDVAADFAAEADEATLTRVPRLPRSGRGRGERARGRRDRRRRRARAGAHRARREGSRVGSRRGARAWSTDVFPAEAEGDQLDARAAGAARPAARRRAPTCPPLQLAGATDRKQVRDRLVAPPRRRCVDRHADEERRLAYVAVTRARSTAARVGLRVGHHAATRATVSPFLDRGAAARRAARRVGRARAGRDQPAHRAGPREPVAARPARPVSRAIAAPGRRADVEARRGAGPRGRRRAADRPRRRAPSSGATTSIGCSPNAPGWRAATPSRSSCRATCRCRSSSSSTATRTSWPAAIRRPVPHRPAPWARRGTAFHRWLEQRWQAQTLLDLDELPGAADETADDADFDALREAFLASDVGQPDADRGRGAVRDGRARRTGRARPDGRRVRQRRATAGWSSTGRPAAGRPAPRPTRPRCSSPPTGWPGRGCAASPTPRCIACAPRSTTSAATRPSSPPRCSTPTGCVDLLAVGECRVAVVEFDHGMTREQLEPGPDHPITDHADRLTRPRPRRRPQSSPTRTNALTLQEASYPAVQYIPLADVDPAVLAKTDDETYCPFKGDASYYTVTHRRRRAHRRDLDLRAALRRGRRDQGARRVLRRTRSTSRSTVPSARPSRCRGPRMNSAHSSCARDADPVRPTSARPFEVLLARSAGREQDQHRRPLAGLVAESVHAALGDVEEVAGARRRSTSRRRRAGSRSGQHEERLRQRLVEVRRGAGGLRSHRPAIQPVVAVRRGADRQVVARTRSGSRDRAAHRTDAGARSPRRCRRGTDQAGTGDQARRTTWPITITTRPNRPVPFRARSAGTDRGRRRSPARGRRPARRSTARTWRRAPSTASTRRPTRPGRG